MASALVECERCHRKLATYVVGFFQTCEVCDAQPAKAIIPARQRFYNCIKCSTLHIACPDDVAAGYRCDCGGDLWAKATLRSDPPVDMAAFLNLDWDDPDPTV